MRGDGVLPYRINFENLGPGSVDASGNPYSTFASAPAQRVTISDQLHSGLNWSTFQLVEVGFGDTIVPIPLGRTHYAGSVSMTFNGQTFNVDLEAGIDLASGRVTAVFQSIDPKTSLPPDVLTGFLPPEDGTGRGQGHFSFLIRARTNLVTGTELRNVALIEFDRQTAISTDQVDPHNPAAGVDPTKQALMTIDAGPPTSSVTPLPAESGRAFIVQWSGEDDIGGIGIGSYDVFVSKDGSIFSPWITGTIRTSAAFVGELGSTYAFYSIARDLVGHQELLPVAPDAYTLVLSNAPTLVTVEDTTMAPGSSLSISNLVQGATVGAPLFSLGPGAPSGATIIPNSGVLRWTPSCSQASRTFPITVWVTDTGRTTIMDAITFTVAVSECVVPGLGRVILLAGESGRVPVNLISSVPLTNLSMTVEAPTDRLMGFEVEPIVPEICDHSLVPLTNNLHWLTLKTCPNQSLIGTQQIAWLHFTAVPNQPSAFVSLQLDNTVGYLADGTPVANFAPQAGRVAIIGEEPLLEALLDTERRPALVLYGRDGWDCDLEHRPSLEGGPTWQLHTNTALGDLFQTFEVPVTTHRAQFFRALRR